MPQNGCIFVERRVNMHLEMQQAASRFPLWYYPFSQVHKAVANGNRGSKRLILS